jgi:hypothetical protein
MLNLSSKDLNPHWTNNMAAQVLVITCEFEKFSFILMQINCRQIERDYCVGLWKRNAMGEGKIMFNF